MQKCRVRQLMINYTDGSDEEIENKLSLLSPSFQKPFVQMVWDKMFMIDLYPENKKKFGVNWSDVIDMIVAKHLTSSSN